MSVQHVTCVVCHQQTTPDICARFILPNGEEQYQHDTCAGAAGQRIKALLAETRDLKRQTANHRRLFKVFLQQHKWAVLYDALGERLQLSAQLQLNNDELSVVSYHVHRDGTRIFEHKELPVALSVYEDNLKEMRKI
jgi:hypothetical protein